MERSMNFFDIIPDIHGQFEKLMALLARLGWHKHNGNWKHTDSDRLIVFLGDFIDRGPNNAAVLRTVRELVDAGRARAIMGNHELNAVHYHIPDPETGEPSKEHNERNEHTHASFLAEFPLGSEGAHHAISWFMTLPLWLEFSDFRVVHACWSDATVEYLRSRTNGGVLSPDWLLAAGRKGSELNRHVELLTKGPEIRLPDGVTIDDVGGQRRDEVRLAWWRKNAKTWPEAVVSVPDPRQLPAGPFTTKVEPIHYHEIAKPLFFGHYWLSGSMRLEAPNALCLDYSAGRDGPLVAYRFTSGERQIVRSNVVGAE